MQATNPSPTSDPATLAHLNRLADASLAAHRAHTDTLIPAAVEAATAEAPASTPCPPWCIIDHTDWREDGDYHYSAAHTAGPVELRLDIDSTDTATIVVRTPGGPGENLDLDEVDALIARLTELRPVLADTITQRRAAA